MAYVRSVEINAKAVFNVMIASMVEGVPKMDDCERLLVLCIHLKDASDRYPLRVLAINICFEMLEQPLLPVPARKLILRFVLGPADFIMHHLEWRISLLERVDQLVKDNSFDDIEFRALLRRVVNKLGMESPTTQIERDKVRLYSYLELVILDPINYTSLDTVSKQMSVAQWADIMHQDLVFHLYLNEFRPQMLLFIETLRVLGVAYSPYTPGLVHTETLRKLPETSHIVIQLSSFSDSLLQYFQGLTSREQPSDQDKHDLRAAFDRALSLALDNRILVQELQFSVHRTRNALQEGVGASALLEIAQILARFVIVTPLRYLSQIMWMVAAVQRVAGGIKQQATSEQVASKIADISTLCLDIWLSCLVYRSEPRSQLNCEHDLTLSLALFVCLFPASTPEIWTDIFASSSGTPSQSLCCIFLQRLAGQLLPLLHKTTHHGSSEVLLAMVCLACEVLSLQIPPEVLAQDLAAFRQTLRAIADQQRDMDLRLFVSMLDDIYQQGIIHPFPTLEARIDALEEVNM
ncbi:hypothetical protein CPC16_008087 [Podila verticillata]|nr:hypothetical protein CPC16_008087 [Podila verticillata]